MPMHMGNPSSQQQTLCSLAAALMQRAIWRTAHGMINGTPQQANLPARSWAPNSSLQGQTGQQVAPMRCLAMMQQRGATAAAIGAAGGPSAWHAPRATVHAKGLMGQCLVHPPASSALIHSAVVPAGSGASGHNRRYHSRLLQHPPQGTPLRRA